MRFVRSSSFCVLVLATLWGTAAQAATVVLHYDTTNYSAGGGGEFRATLVGVANSVEQAAGVKVSNPSAPVGATVYQTFCMETNEFFTPDATYYVRVNTAAVNGGSGGSLPTGDPISGGPGDPLDPRTAYLYTRFSDGTLASLGYNYTLGSGRTSTASALQQAIWYIEQEISGPLSGLALTFYNTANTAVNGPSPTWAGLGNVRVLNVYSDFQSHAAKPGPARAHPAYGRPAGCPSPGRRLVGRPHPRRPRRQTRAPHTSLKHRLRYTIPVLASHVRAISMCPDNNGCTPSPAHTISGRRCRVALNAACSGTTHTAPNSPANSFTALMYGCSTALPSAGAGGQITLGSHITN